MTSLTPVGHQNPKSEVFKGGVFVLAPSQSEHSLSACALPGALPWVSKVSTEDPKQTKRSCRLSRGSRVGSCAHHNDLHGERGYFVVCRVEGRAWHVLYSRVLLNSLGMSCRQVGALCACLDHCCATKGQKQKNWTTKRSCPRIPVSGGLGRTEHLRPAWAKSSRPA